MRFKRNNNTGSLLLANSMFSCFSSIGIQPKAAVAFQRLFHTQYQHDRRCQMQLCPPCNTVRSGHFCICNRVRGYVKTIRRTYGCTCARVSERACTEPTYIMQQEYSRIVWLQLLNTQRPNYSHFLHFIFAL